ncbi:ABC transporter substrate-binding protein [Planktothrix sp. FACHB-1365]|uniref:ABC transporter substrate-binding protein n=1 Tax=Planktothrix sp. FACHB-1365 TaxID=2692855 RepID=UPI001681DD3B|nr:ABC transporter substrate-binding protein [Planktothrix sp. FACHB-1365]MBD2481586.1 amino acid ABC transporter substrate-binding protein [Planktothrix sp. FACHB-1365]
MTNSPDPNGPWKCTGIPPGSHLEMDNEGDECDHPKCKNTRSGIIQPKPQPNGNKSKKFAPIVSVLVVAALLGAGWWWLKPGQTPEVPPETPPTTNPPFPPPPPCCSSGEKVMFIGKTNPDRENGIKEFKAGNYRQAIKDFEKAVDGDPTSPELQIYFNNAKARHTGNPFVLAVVVPIDSNETSAEEILRGVADAQTQFNDSKGLNNQLLEIMIGNDSNTPAIATTVAQQLANHPNILAVIGHNSSDASKAALVEYEKAGIAMVSPTSTSTELSGNSFFRTLPSDVVSGAKLANYVWKTLILDRVAIFYNPKSSYSNSLYQVFAQKFQQLGGQVVKTIDINDSEFNAEQEIKAIQNQAQAQAIVLFPNTDTTSRAINVARAVGNEPASQRLTLLGGDALYSPETLTSGSNAVEGLILAVPWVAETDYAKRAERRWQGDVSWRTAMSFDATQALIKTLSSGASRTTVLQNLKNTNLSSSETAGEALVFEPTGDRQAYPILVEVVRSPGGPKGSSFAFKPIR